MRETKEVSEAATLNERIDTVGKWTTVLSNKVGGQECKIANNTADIAEIKRHLTDVDKRIEALEEKVTDRDAQLKGHDALWLAIRIGELEAVWNKLSNGLKCEDITIRLESDVSLDIHALKLLEETDLQRFGAALIGFDFLYGLPFARYADKIIAAPPEVSWVINKRANVTFLPSWKLLPAPRDWVIRKANYILSRWDNKQNRYYPNAQLRQEYAELEECYKNKGAKR